MGISTRLVLLLAPLAAGCMSTYMRDSQPTSPPGPGECKVVVYRSSYAGYQITFPIYDGEKFMGFTEVGNAFEYRCPPGKHLFLSWSENEKVVDATLAPGKTYYLESYAKIGFFVQAAGLDPISRHHNDWPRVEEIVAKLRWREAVPEKAAEHEERRREKARKIMQEHAEGREDPKFMMPEDGKPETPAPIGRGSSGP